MSLCCTGFAMLADTLASPVYRYVMHVMYIDNMDLLLLSR